MDDDEIYEEEEEEREWSMEAEKEDVEAMGVAAARGSGWLCVPSYVVISIDMSSAHLCTWNFNSMVKTILIHQDIMHFENIYIYVEALYIWLYVLHFGNLTKLIFLIESNFIDNKLAVSFFQLKSDLYNYPLKNYINFFGFYFNYTQGSLCNQSFTIIH